MTLRTLRTLRTLHTLRTLRTFHTFIDLGVIIGVAFSTDHTLVLKTWLGDDASDPIKVRNMANSLQGYAFVIMYGTAFMFVKELLVLMFQHVTAPLQSNRRHVTEAEC